eukprot:m.41099 g.41099  ORF g.41099 m.41099 type:complete len:52 (+) comp6076_c0_seq1:207-362(+)
MIIVLPPLGTTQWVQPRDVPTSSRVFHGKDNAHDTQAQRRHQCSSIIQDSH